MVKGFKRIQSVLLILIMVCTTCLSNVITAQATEFHWGHPMAFSNGVLDYRTGWYYNLYEETVYEGDVICAGMVFNGRRATNAVAIMIDDKVWYDVDERGNKTFEQDVSVLKFDRWSNRQDRLYLVTGYEASYYVDGEYYATQEKSVYVKYPKTPTKEGYIFDYWVNDKGKRVNNGDILTGDLKFYPRWKPAKIGDVGYSSLADAIAAAPSNGTETIIDIIYDEEEVEVEIPEGKNIVLRLNDHTLTGKSETGEHNVITNHGKLTIDGSGKIQTAEDLSGCEEAFRTIYSDGELIINNGTFETRGGFWDDKVSTIHVAGGTAIINGGNFDYLQNSNCTWEKGTTVIRQTEGFLQINDGTFYREGWYPVATFTGGMAAINDGTFTGTISSNNKEFVTGGVFNNSDGTVNNYLAKNYITKDYHGASLVVKDGNVAKLGNKEYGTIEEAIAAVEGSHETTITLLANQIDVEATIPSGKNVVLDLNGYKLTGKAEKGEHTVITNNGTLTIKDSSEYQEGKIQTARDISGCEERFYNHLYNRSVKHYWWNS